MSIFSDLVGPVTGLLDKFIEDKDKKNAIAFELATLTERFANDIAKGQIETNKISAAHPSIFVAGWRPAVGWICALAMASNFLFIPMANFILALTSTPVSVPMIQLSEMMPVLLGMLGLGGLRTVEKAKGVQRDQ